MARKATTKKFAEKKATGITAADVKNMDMKELKENLRLYGKRAQSRLKALEKSMPRLREKGQEGVAQMILDRYVGYNTKTKGLSANALRSKLYKAISLLQSEMSTASGISKSEQKKYESFKKHYPGFQDISIDRYRQIVKIMGKAQYAHEGLDYDSDRDVTAAWYLTEMDIPDEFYTKIKNPNDFFEDDEYTTLVTSAYGIL